MMAKQSNEPQSEEIPQGQVPKPGFRFRLRVGVGSQDGPPRVAHGHGGDVVRLSGAGSKLLDRGQNSLNKIVWTIRFALLQKDLKTLDPEHFPLRIGRFGDAIGVEKESVAGQELSLAGRIICVFQHAQHRAAHFRIQSGQLAGGW